MKIKLFIVAIVSMIMFASCKDLTITRKNATSDSGVEKATIKVETDVDGNTIEQKNIMERYRRDNLPGSIKHLYVISPLSGQVLLYSTVKGKVTSSSKRLTPESVVGDGFNTNSNNNVVYINGRGYTTNEVMGDDGTYGPSIQYLYWFDSKGVYHQHYLGGNEMLHISDQPLAVKSILLNLEER